MAWIEKPLPRAVDKRQQKRDGESADRKAREEIRRLDQRRCRVCGRKTNVVHEEKRRGAGGKVTPANSYLACDVIDGGVCHPLLQQYRIYPRLVSGAEEFNAREDLVFEMTEKIAALAFEGRPRPLNARIVES